MQLPVLKDDSFTNSGKKTEKGVDFPPLVMRCFCCGREMGNSSGKRMPREPFPDVFPFTATLWTCSHPALSSSKLYTVSAGALTFVSPCAALSSFKPRPPFPKFSAVSHSRAGLGEHSSPFLVNCSVYPLPAGSTSNLVMLEC